MKRKHIPSPPFILSDQSTIFDSKAKAKALAKFFHSVYLQATNITSSHIAVINDCVAQLDAITPPLINTEFLTPYVVLNIVKRLPNNEAPDNDRLSTAMIKNCAFKIIL